MYSLLLFIAVPVLPTRIVLLEAGIWLIMLTKIFQATSFLKAPGQEYYNYHHQVVNNKRIFTHMEYNGKELTAAL